VVQQKYTTCESSVSSCRYQNVIAAPPESIPDVSSAKAGLAVANMTKVKVKLPAYKAGHLTTP